MSIERILVLATHYLNSIKRNKSRLLDILVWPAVELTVFGFMASYWQHSTDGMVKIVAVLLGSLIFWNFTSRISNELSQPLFDDVLTRNMQNIVASPARLSEMIVALMVTGLLKLGISLAILLVVARIIFGFWLVNIGGQIVPIILILLLWGMAVGLVVVGFLFGVGTKALPLTYMVTGLVQPFACVFYSRAVLPGEIRWLTYLVPPAYIFENYRQLMSGGLIPMVQWIYPILLSFLYLVLALVWLRYFYQRSRRNGMLTRI